MSDSFEKILKKIMQWLGRVVESIIGKAKQASDKVSTRSGMQPVLSLESLLPPARIKEIIEAAVERVLAETLPVLTGSAALEIGEGPAAFGEKLMSRQANSCISVEIGGASIGRQGDLSRGYVIRSDVSKLPFPNSVFGYVLGRMASSFQGDITKATREISRVMAFGGRGVVIDYHPFGLYAKKGQNRIRALDHELKNIEDYYKLFKKDGLRVTDLREAFVDDTMRGCFKGDEISAYRSLKATPLLIFLFVYKPKGK